jgi:outer membrane protein TolC
MKSSVKHIFTFTFISVIILFSKYGFSQITINNVGDAYSVALKNNPELKAAATKNKVASLDSKIVQSALYPTINLSSDFNYNYALPTQLIPAKIFGGKDGEYKALNFGTDYSMNAFVDANIPLINTSIWNNIKQNKTQTQQVILRSKLKEIEVKRNVANAYYAVLMNTASEKIAMKMIAVCDTLFEST